MYETHRNYSGKSPTIYFEAAIKKQQKRWDRRDVLASLEEIKGGNLGSGWG